MTCSSTPRRALALLSTVLLLAALVALLVRVAPSSAQGSPAGCSPRAAHSGSQGRVCAALWHGTHAKTKAKHHHAKRVAAKKKKSKHQPATYTPAIPAPVPAVCEDASTPVRESEGSYSCADGSEPICGNGSEPALASKGPGPVCPTAAKPVVEFSEASCEDGSAPAGASGGYTCDDGSHPECEDGSPPVLSGDGSMLACTTYASAGSGSTPSSPSGEEFEGADKALVVSAS